MTPLHRDSRFQRADANGDGIHDLADAVAILFHLFAGAESRCLDALDASDDGQIDITDPIGLLASIFREGFQPKAPFATCGFDPTEDDLACESFAACP